MIDSEDDKRKRDRSPSSPYIALDEAVQRTEQLFKEYGKHPARVHSLAPLWGYSPSSSSLLRIIAALKMYGLVDESGASVDRKLAVSELGSRIAADKRHGARESAIQTAFNRCEVLADLRAHWGAKRPPDDACVSELHLDYKFTAEAARKLISVYDASLSYAKVDLLDSYSLPENVEVDSSLSMAARGRSLEEAVNERSLPLQAARVSAGMSQAIYPLQEGSCTLAWPSHLSAKSARKLKKWLQLMMDDVEETIDDQAALDEGTDLA